MNAGPLVSDCYRALLGPAVDFVRRHANHRNVVIVGATKMAADEIAFAAVESRLAGIYRFDCAQLARELARTRLAERQLFPAERISLEALSASVAFNAAKRGDIPTLARVARMPRFPKALCRTLTELRLEHVRPEQLIEAGGAAIEIGALLREYEAALKLHRIADLAVTYRLASEAAESGISVLNHAAIVLLCPPLQHKAQFELLDSAASQASDLLALGLRSGRRLLERLVGAECDGLEGPLTTAVGAIQGFLFEPGDVPAREPDATFELFSAAGEALEAVEIARRIQALARQGYRFDEIAVLVRAAEVYCSVIVEAFSRAGIPLWFADGLRAPHASGRALLCLLEFARDGFRLSKFSEYLSLNQVPGIDEGASAEPVHIGRWSRILGDANVAGGRERWPDQLNAAKGAVGAEIEAADDEPARARALRRLEILDSLCDFVLPLIALLADWPDNGSWAEWRAWLMRLISLGIRDPEPVNGLIESLAALDDIRPVTADEVIRCLAEHLTTVREKNTGYRYGRVFVGEPADVEGLPFRAVFIAGLSEGAFPKRVHEDPLLLNEVRARVSTNLKCVAEEDERVHLLKAVATTSDKLIASYPRMDLLSGRARVPSLYAFELVKASGGNTADLHSAVYRPAITGARPSWPAPRNAADAIDAAEYDLARLRPAFEGQPCDGLAAYVQQCSDALERSLKARFRRWNRENWTSSDGFIDLTISREPLLARHTLSARTYTASLLESFAVCPYQFYLRAIYGLRTERAIQPTWQLSAADRGRIYHAATARYFQRLLTEEGRGESLNARLELMDESLTSIAREFERELEIHAPMAWSSELLRLRTDLRGLVREVDREPEWTAIAAELSFGSRFGRGCDPASSADPVTVLDTLRLAGRIDRVDRHGSNLLRIVDYKTGTYNRADALVVHGGTVLQPLLYAMAAAQFFGMRVLGGRLLYATTKGRFRAHSVALNDNNAAILRNCLESIDSAILNADFPAAPLDGACKRCDYRPVCGPHEEERMKHKQTIASLASIRRQK